MARLERVLVSSRKTSLLIMLGKVLQSSCRMKMDVMMMPRASDCASTLRPYAHQMATVVTWLVWARVRGRGRARVRGRGRGSGRAN